MEQETEFYRKSMNIIYKGDTLNLALIQMEVDNKGNLKSTRLIL